MQDVLLIIVLLIFVCLGFPAMKRLDRFLNKNFKNEDTQTPAESTDTGKKNKTML